MATDAKKTEEVLTLEQYRLLPNEEKRKLDSILFSLAAHAAGQNTGVKHQRPTGQLRRQHY